MTTVDFPLTTLCAEVQYLKDVDKEAPPQFKETFINYKLLKKVSPKISSPSSLRISC
jgi:hypothetical protein